MAHEQAMQDVQMKRKFQLEYKYAVTGWALFVLPEICSQVMNMLTRENHLVIGGGRMVASSSLLQ